MMSRERSPSVPEALSVPCPGCKARVGERCRTYISGYELPHSTHEIRQLDVLRAELEAVKNGPYARANEILRRQVDDCLVRARDAERAHLQMVRKAGDLRDERDRLREALDAIGSVGGPLHMLEPDCHRPSGPCDCGECAARWRLTKALDRAIAIEDGRNA